VQQTESSAAGGSSVQFVTYRLVPKVLRGSGIALVSPISPGNFFPYLKRDYGALDTLLLAECGSSDIDTESDLFSGALHV
jgi:hypothetical protein